MCFLEISLMVSNVYNNFFTPIPMCVITFHTNTNVCNNAPRMQSNKCQPFVSHVPHLFIRMVPIIR